MVRLVFIAVVLIGIGITIPMGSSAFSGDPVNVYPNPFKTEFTIDLTNYTSEVNITVTDLLGNIVLEKNVTNDNFVVISLEEQDLKPGIYIINLKSIEQSISKRIVKK
jgi:hypothetical protein